MVHFVWERRKRGPRLGPGAMVVLEERAADCLLWLNNGGNEFSDGNDFSSGLMTTTTTSSFSDGDSKGFSSSLMAFPPA
jgi:hypothetical protein